jgi:hypothetical protein
MQRLMFLILTLLLCPIVFLTSPVSAMDGGEYGEFQKLMLEPLDSLTDKADLILKQKYEKKLNETIPFFVMTNLSSYVAYRIAALKPGLLSGYECYEPCEGRQLHSLLECFFKDGESGAFVDLAASCPVCYGEAISIFLWDEMGARKGEIIGGLRFRYDPDVREPQQPLP